ncbi:MAG: cbb3-type cytochrome c oxidase N-terminal domain-containing protein, partial [Flavobacteriales bacterium]
MSTLRMAMICLGVLFLQSPLLSQVDKAIPAAQAAAASPYTSPIFYALCFVAILLLVFILQLAKVLSTVARNYKRGDKSLWERSRIILALIAFTALYPENAVAAAPAPISMSEQTPMLDFLHDGFGSNAINALAFIIFFELLAVVYLMRLVRLFTTKEPEWESAKQEEKSSITSPLWDKLNASVAITEEQAIMTDHEYDGIRELDNSLPPWWKYGFYLTIVWAFGYMLYYHISNGPSSEQEYKAQMKQAELAIEEYRKNAKNLVDETTVSVLTEAADINSGKAIFGQYCAVCHAADGGGIVGPNLTDNYWLHGSDIKNMFSTIKYGVQGKGMKSWQQELSPVMMAQVASFITT